MAKKQPNPLTLEGTRSTIPLFVRFGEGRQINISDIAYVDWLPLGCLIHFSGGKTLPLPSREAVRFRAFMDEFSVHLSLSDL